MANTGGNWGDIKSNLTHLVSWVQIHFNMVLICNDIPMNKVKERTSK